MKTALVILAAGIGARYGGGIKQLEPVGPMGEIIMDYSIHDAIAAGFDKIVFIIRRDIEADFRQVIGDRIEAICRRLGVEVAYAKEVPCIINRTRTGRCPLETLCDVSDNPVELYPVIEDFVRRMREAGEKEKTISEK